MDNLKDLQPQGLSLKTQNLKDSPLQSRLEKLTTAIYIVTNCMNVDEPIRGRLRTAALDLLSNSYQLTAISYQLMSLINISETMSFISPMNASILKNELSLLQNMSSNTEVKLEDYFVCNPLLSEEGVGGGNLKDHHLTPTVHRGTPPQQGGERIAKVPPMSFMHKRTLDEDARNDRQGAIIKIIKDMHGEATIKDITQGLSLKDINGNALSPKTIQRELMSLTNQGLIKKTGTKRWSRYSAMSL